MVTFLSCMAMMFLSTCRALGKSMVTPDNDAEAASRVNAPSSSRTLERIERAMNSATSSGRCTCSLSAFLCRIVILVSRSGGRMSAIRPASKRERILSSIAGDLLGQAVGGDYNLLLLFVERVERVEELLLGTFLAGNELDIVDEQHINGANLIAETDHAVE